MLKVNVDASRLFRRLDRIRKNLNTLPWNQAAGVVLGSVIANFEVGGRHSGKGNVMGGSQKWEPRKDNLSHKLLKKSGKLQAANYMEVHKNGFAIGNRLEYQAVHNFGYPKRNITARPYLVVQEDDLRQIEDMMVEHIKS
jgi:phage gpG-like protein